MLGVCQNEEGGGAPHTIFDNDAVIIIIKMLRPYLHEVCTNTYAVGWLFSKLILTKNNYKISEGLIFLLNVQTISQGNNQQLRGFF